MSTDVEEHLGRALDTLAEHAPQPERWALLGGIATVHRMPGRPRRTAAMALAVAAALVLVVGAAIVVANRDAGRPAQRVHAASSPTAAPPSTNAVFDGGSWDLSGPSLTDDQLAQVVMKVTRADGSALWQPTTLEPVGGPGVSRVQIVKTTFSSALHATRLGGNDGDPFEAHYLHGVSTMIAPSSTDPNQPVWVVAATGSFDVEPGCVDASDATPCAASAATFVWFVPVADASAAPAPISFYQDRARVDLAVLGQVGTWTPTSS